MLNGDFKQMSFGSFVTFSRIRTLFRIKLSTFLFYLKPHRGGDDFNAITSCK